MSNEDILKDLGHIRSLMEKSNKFISLSGLSGVVVGIYTLLATAFWYTKLKAITPEGSSIFWNIGAIQKEFIISGSILLVMSVFTGVWMAKCKAEKSGQSVSNPASKAMLNTIGVPLLTGGAFAIIAGIYGGQIMVIPSFLVFYGLALYSGSHFTFKEIKYLGLFEIILGLLAFVFFQYGLLFFATGFGLLHIIYGMLILKRHGA